VANIGFLTRNKEILLATFVSLVARVAAAFSGFIVSFFVARSLGVTESGYYFLAFAIISLLASVSRVGLDNTVLRFIGSTHHDKSTSLANSVLHKALLLIFNVSLVLSLILYFSADFVSESIFNKPELAPVLKNMSPAIMGVALFSIVAMAFQGMKRIISSVFILNICINILLVFALFFVTTTSAARVGQYYSMASFITLVLGMALYYRYKDDSNNKVAWRTLFTSSLPLWVVVLMGQLVLWTGQLTAGIWASEEQIAQLAIAQRVAMLTSFILVAVNMVVAPRFAYMYKEQKYQELQSLAVMSVKLITLIAFPLLLIMLIFPHYILSFFGQGFAGGAIYLQILAIGQFINVITGSVGYLLSMSGHEKDLRNTTLVSGVLVLVLCVILVPLIGALGGAIATAIAVATQNLLAVFWVKKRLGFNTLKVW
jgi:O-antigen/teichoic acid export membrane protein